MKNKPQRHKESNVFRFKSFGDRINEIDVRRNALYHIRHVNEEADTEANETEFHQTYCKWVVLNLTEEYNAFQKDIRHIVTLPQLIHKKDFVVERLLTSLRKSTTLSVQPLLEFVVVLARDLREDFYPHFRAFLAALIHALNTKDSDQLEWSLICLAHLFKTLKPYLKKDITVVFQLILPLLDDRNPEHVTNFAAECFSFVARDIKQKDKFLALILNGLREHSNGISGCGRLLVDIVRGVNGQFHTCAEDFMTVCFDGLAETDAYEQNILHEVLISFVENLVQIIHPANMQLYWDVCLGSLSRYTDDAAKQEKAIKSVLALVGQAVEYREGKWLTDSSKFVTTIGKTLNANGISEDCLLLATQIVAIILQAKNLTLTQLNASLVIGKVIKLPFSRIFEAFVWNTVNYSQFEVLILPEFLRYIDGAYYNITSLELLAKIVLTKSPLCRDGSQLAAKTFYALRFKSDKALKKIEATIANATVHASSEANKELLLAVIVYPHIQGASSAEQMCKKLAGLIGECCGRLDRDTAVNTHIDEDQVNNNRQLIFTLSLLVEAQIHLSNNARGKPTRINAQPIVEAILPFAANEDYHYVQALRLLDLVVTSEITHGTYFNLKQFASIHEKLSNRLSSRFSDIRLITSHLFQQYSQKLNVGKLPNGQSVYAIINDVELIVPSVQSYREQLLHLQKIEASAQLFDAVTKEYLPCKFDALKYLLGYLYVNFNLLWKPLTELIHAYAAEMDLAEFWPIFERKINETTKLVRAIERTIECEYDAFGAESVLHMEFVDAHKNTERAADLINYRILIWKMIPTLGMMREIKNREIVTVFLDFIREEYSKGQDHDTFTWNVLRNRRDDQSLMDVDDADEASDEEMDVGDDDDKSKKKNRDEVGEIPKATQRTLITMLAVFVNQANPKQLHREPELAKLYMQLLSHRNTAVQKLALDCLVAYKHKYLTPYKEHVYDLIDDGKFKEAIANFKIDKEGTGLQEDHRNGLMPILMRILFSKMQMRVGGQKHTNQLRKSLVMRFLGGCHEDEILAMLSMSFWMLEEKFGENCVETCRSIVEHTDLTRVLSPRKLQSCIDLIDVIQGEFSGLMSVKFHKYLLNATLAIGATIHGVLREEQSRISAKTYTQFKQLRGTCVANLQRFFDHFHLYPWDDDAIGAVFMVFVNPLVAKLSQDSLVSATPLLKLLTVWGKTPRLFVLLTKITASDAADDEDTTPLRYLMDLLVQPKARPLVCIAVMETVQNFLNAADELEDDATPLELTGCRPVDQQRIAMISEPISRGCQLLLPYLPKILEKFRINLKKRRGLTRRDISILSRATGLITDAATCNTLLTLLLPILVRKSHSSAGEEALLQMVNTIINLFAKIDRPEAQLRNIAPMFEQIVAVGPRKRLCDLLRTINERSGGKLTTMVDVIVALNAWDQRWIEQPDYEKRLLAYKRISELLEADEIDLNFGLLIVYHSFFFIRHDRDLALRDNASHHLRTLVPALIRKYQRENPRENDYLIGTVILNMVRRTLRDRNDAVRNEGIQLLGEIARECPTAHPVLSDLHCLTSKLDREIDFFDNVTHLQVLRHGKALLRFSTVAKTLETAPNPRTLTQFILPLCSLYIGNEKYAAKHGLVTSAIEAIGSVCHLLPWFQYESVLKYYLKSMRFNVEYQKQMVRIVMQILDAFHFDLSKAQVSPKEIEAAVKKVAAQEIDAEANQLTVATDKMVDEEKKAAADDEEIVLDENINADADFDDELDNINQGEDGDDSDADEPTPVKKVKVCVFDVATVLSHSVAKKIVQTIATGLIPTLNKSITALSTFESFHKLNKKKRRSEREEEEILRVPIALAIVKLLQKLPEGMLDHNLPGIFMKVCLFLRSPLISVRKTTRDILQKIMVTVGANYLDLLLSHMSALLTRGFQVHVLTVTVHSVLDSIKSSLKRGTIDKSLSNILEVCLRDIFGQTAEEKEINKIGRHTPEAKPHNKSFLSLNIVSSHISESCLLDLLIPFKDILARSHAKKTVLKVTECFQKIVAGLNVNKHIAIESMLTFIYGTASESIPSLVPPPPRPVLNEKEREKLRRVHGDCLLIPDDPAAQGRSGGVKKAVVKSGRATTHVLVEFGIELLLNTLKRGKLLKIDYQPFIDPIVPTLLASLNSQHIRVTTLTLKSLLTMWAKELQLTQLNQLAPAIIEEIFKILHRYVASNTDMSNENFGLVQSAFKTLVALLRNASAKVSLSSDQLKMLLLYVEQYLAVNDSNKQTISFSLLKVIIARRLKIAELNDVVLLVAQLAIQSDSSVARAESKGIIVNYLMEYSLKKERIQGFLDFFLSNLEYEMQFGRESAINILHSIVKRFPPVVLNRKGKFDFLFVRCGSQLVNDESPECRQQIAECLETLLARIEPNSRNDLFAIVEKYLDASNKASVREMGAMLCTRFINSEKAKFDGRIKTILPLLVSALSQTPEGAKDPQPGQFVRIAQPDIVEDEDEDEDAVMDDEEDAATRREQKQRALDHQHIQVLNTILKIFEKYPNSSNFDPNTIDILAYEAQRLLAHDHVWVRINALNVLASVLQRIDVDELLAVLLKGKVSTSKYSYLYENPEQELYSLSLDLCAQLVPDETDKDVAELVAKNLLFIANIVKEIPYGDAAGKSGGADDDAAEEKENGNKRKINLPWLLRRMRYVVHAEVAKATHSIVLRSSVFEWVESLVLLLPEETVRKLAYTLLTPLVREMSEEDKNVDSRLRKIALRVGDGIREKVGDDEYNLLRSQIQRKLMIKRAERKKVIAMEKISDPVRAAQRTKGIRDRKKIGKRRRIDEAKSRVVPKKKRVKPNSDMF